MFSTVPVRGLCLLQCLVAAALSAACSPAVAQSSAGVRPPAEISSSARTRVTARPIDEGRDTFRFDTFGDEAFWTGALQLHKAIEGAALGGAGAGVGPRTALAVGLKVDSDALPASLIDGIRAGKVNLAKLLGVSETTVRAVLAGWGPGKFDAEVFLDGKGFRPTERRPRC